MSSARVLRGLVLGALGGFLGWALVEPFDYLTSDRPGPVDMTAIGVLGAIIGLGIGLALGVSEGIAGGTRSKFLRAVWMGSLLGVAGGLVGLWMGQTLYGMMEGRPGQVGSVTQFFWQILARSLGWALIGAGVGLSVGVPSQSPRKIWHGLVGGTVGGFLGGFSFQTLSQSRLPFAGEHLRMIGFTSIGAAVGFFVSLVDEALKQAWVRVLVGRNEGREYILDRPVNVLGRDELAEVPLFGDIAVGRHHAAIERVGGRYVLRDLESAAGTLLNGQRVQQAVLRDGDRVQVGGRTIVFYEKATASRLRRPSAEHRPLATDHRPPSPERAAAAAGAAGPAVAPNICPFCGTARDPVNGACACSVDAGTGLPAPTPLSAGTGGEPYPASLESPPSWQGQGAGGAGLSPEGFGLAPAGEGASARLVLLSGPEAGRSFLLGEGVTTIGRDSSQDLAFPDDPTTSRRHATVTWENGAYVLRDAGSTNGTRVGEQRISEHFLVAGDAIHIGAQQFRFEA